MEDSKKEKKEFKTCPVCKEEVLKEAKRCKHCKANLKVGFERHPILYTIIIFILTFLLIGMLLPDSDYDDYGYGEWSREKCNENARQRVELNRRALGHWEEGVKKIDSDVVFDTYMDLVADTNLEVQKLEVEYDLHCHRFNY